MKEVIKTLLENAPKQKGGEKNKKKTKQKNANDVNDRINTTNVWLKFGIASWQSFFTT